MTPTSQTPQAPPTAAPAHHAPEEALLEYATGVATEPAALAMACHVSLCPTCARQLGALEALGGALLAQGPAQDLAPGALEAALGQLDADPRAAPAPAAEPPAPALLASLGLPRPLLRYVAALGAEPRWRFLVPGVRVIDLGVTAPGTTVRLVKFRPGITIPFHDHAGPEHIVVFTGAIEEEGRRFGRGDIAMRDSGERHEQRVATGEPCVSLVVNEGALLPLTLRGRLLVAIARD